MSHKETDMYLEQVFEKVMSLASEINKLLKELKNNGYEQEEDKIRRKIQKELQS